MAIHQMVISLWMSVPNFVPIRQVDVRIFYWVTDNFDLMVVARRNKGAHLCYVTIHPLVTLNVCTKLQSDPSDCCWANSFWTKVFGWSTIISIPNTKIWITFGKNKWPNKIHQVKYQQLLTLPGSSCNGSITAFIQCYKLMYSACVTIEKGDLFLEEYVLEVLTFFPTWLLGTFQTYCSEHLHACDFGHCRFSLDSQSLIIMVYYQK